MKNISMTVKDGKMTLVVDLKKDFGPSSSGKTLIVASSEGNQNVPDHKGVRFGLNVYKYAETEKGAEKSTKK